MPSTNSVQKQVNSSKPTLGVLRGRVTLKIQTRQAFRLIHGRRGEKGVPPILGLLGFAEKLKTVWNGAKADDPYAHWWLWEVEQALKQTRNRIRQTHESLIRQRERHCALEISEAISMDPEKIVLQFANPYAFIGAQMVAEYDRLICCQRTLVHIGLVLTAEQEQQIGTCERRIRATFLVPQRYRCLGIDKKAIEECTLQAQQAQKQMGEISEAILTGQRRATLAPRPRTALQIKPNAIPKTS